MPLRGIIFHLLGRAVAVAGLLCVFATSVQAVQIYTYTGNPFTTARGAFSTTDFLTLQFTLTQALADSSVTNLLTTPDLVAGSFAASAGSFSLTLADVTANASTILEIETDATGAIVGWQFTLRTGAEADFPDLDRILTCFDAPNPGGDCTGEADLVGLRPLIPTPNPNEGLVFNNHGEWSVVPEPSTLSLVTLGLLGLGASRRGR